MGNIACSVAGSCPIYKSFMEVADKIGMNNPFDKKEIFVLPKNDYECRIIAASEDLLSDQANEKPKYELTESQMSKLRDFNYCSHLDMLNQLEKIVNALNIE